MGSLATNAYRGLKRLYPSVQAFMDDAVDVVNNLLLGKLNATGTLTLTANTTTTTLTDSRIGANSTILLMPTTANAAGALGTTYVSARTEGSATITHANAATTDRTFSYLVIG